MAIQDELLHRVEDPYSYLIMLSPEDGSTAQVKRDQNYKLISPIIHLEEFYQPKQRA
ncbi:transposase, partial [Vibrio anguillarum]|nr:transposase [Vibrio anguillarum]